MTQTSIGPLTTEAARHAWQRFAAAWEDGDVSGIDALFADDSTYHVPPFPDLDKQGLKDFVAVFRQGFHDVHVPQEEVMVDDARSLHRWSADAVFAGTTPMLPVAPTGLSTNATGTLLFHWQDGKIVEAWHAGDWLGWLTQAGVLPALG